MTEAERITADTLNVVQQALRGALLSIAAAAQTDLAKCASLMQLHVADQQDRLDPRAAAMLEDLAAGFDLWGQATRGGKPDA